MNRDRARNIADNITEICKTIHNRITYAEVKKVDDTALSKMLLEEIGRAEREVRNLRRLVERKEASTSLGNAVTALTKLVAEDMRSPGEKAFGLEPGEAYGEDDIATTEEKKRIEGYDVVLTTNEESGTITAWVKGLGDIASKAAFEDYDLVAKVRRILKRVRAGEDLKTVKKTEKSS